MDIKEEIETKLLRHQRLAPPRLGKLTMPKTIFDEVIAHFKENGTDESCGIFGIADGRVVSMHRVKNVHKNPYTNYTMDSQDLFKAVRAIDDEGGEPAFYHSHTHSQAFPSPTDMREAHWTDSYYLIGSAETYRAMDEKASDDPIMRAFSIKPAPQSWWRKLLGFQSFEVAEEPLVIEG